MCPDLTGRNTTRTHERTAPDAMRRPQAPGRARRLCPPGRKRRIRTPSPGCRRSPRHASAAPRSRVGGHGRWPQGCAAVRVPRSPAEPGGRCGAGTPLAVRPETVSAQSGANPRSPGAPRSSKRTRADTLVYRFARVPVKWRGGERRTHARDEERAPCLERGAIYRLRVGDGGRGADLAELAGRHVGLIDLAGLIDWSMVGVDSTSCRAHQHAAGARKARPRVPKLGRSRGGLTCKRRTVSYLKGACVEGTAADRAGCSTASPQPATSTSLATAAVHPAPGERRLTSRRRCRNWR